MLTSQKAIRKPEDLFEKKVLHALTHVKNGSITVIKQDNLIIQVNITENLAWAQPAKGNLPECHHLKTLV